MSFFKDNADKIKIGMHGEELLRTYLKKGKYNFMQVDLIVESEEKIYLIEVKTQEKFKAPPCDGHGLPAQQIKARIRLADKTGMIPLLYIYDLDDKLFYMQDMRVLMDGEKFFTKTGSRIIFPLDRFKTLKVEP